MIKNDKKLIYSILIAIVFIAVIVFCFSLFSNQNKDLYVTLYSPIDNYKKVIKIDKNKDVYKYLNNHEIEGYDFIGWFYDDDLTLKVSEGTYLKNNQILKAGYSSIIIKDNNGFNKEILNDKFLTIRTINTTLNKNDFDKILNNKIEYLDLSKAVIENNLLFNDIFKNNSSLKEIILPNDLNIIGERAFKNCYNLEKIIINNKLKTIKNEAFYNCLKLKEINIENVEELGDYIFTGCDNLKSLKLGENLKKINEYSFYNTNLENVELNNLNENYLLDCNILYTIDNKQIIKAFKNINENVYINDNVEIIKKFAFDSCQNLKQISLSNNLKTIENNAFKNCKNLNNIVFKDNNHYNIEFKTFYGCEKLKEIKFSVGLNSLGDECFKNCVSLKKIDFNNSTSLDVSNLKTIGNACFENCKSLEFFVMPDSVDNIGQGIFKDCVNLSIVNLSSRVKNIPDKTFFNNSNLKKVIASTNILSIGNGCFEGCKKLENINTLSYSLLIGNKAFKNCESLEEVYFDNVEFINEECFYGCLSLKNISLKNVKYFNKYSFYGCLSLKKFNIEKETENIEKTVFDNCENLETFTCVENVNFKVNNGVLYDYNLNNLLIYPQGKKDKELLILSSVNKLNFDSLISNKNLISIKVEEDNQNFSSQDGVLYNLNKTELLIYPSNKQGLVYQVIDSVKTIKEKSFSLNQNLISLIIGNNVEVIEKGALNNVLKLKILKLPFIGKNNNENKFLGYIFGADSYYNNYSFVPKTLENIEITNDDYIDNYSFYDLRYIKNIKYNCNVSIINEYAFYNNVSLEEVYLKGAISLIKEKSFSGIENLRKLTFGFNENLKIEENSFEGLKYSLEVNILNNGQHVAYTLRTQLKNKFINVYKRAEYWKWLF